MCRQNLNIRKPKNGEGLKQFSIASLCIERNMKRKVKKKARLKEEMNKTWGLNVCKIE